ncbi:MAG TPA: PEP/pyruvate-binding domain-containing protein [Thermoanaerobaculia bacterium]|nr:PEP/pyruvate-binding domain-containing protein [Thermoanaerobaculia bacterium]
MTNTATARLFEVPDVPAVPLPRAPWVWIPGEGAARTVLPLLGGKGRGLVRLQEAGQPVPPWFGVTAAAFRLGLGGLRPEIAGRLQGLSADAPAAVRAAAEEIRGWIRGVELPAEMAMEIRRAQAEALPGDGPLAVRSSALDEDGAGGSFAGLHDSFLGVRGRQVLLDAIRAVWASAFQAEALTYRLIRGLPLDGIEMAVVVQRMVAARVSGVLFTANPATGDVHEIVISSLYGLGEGLVGLGLDADRYTVDKATLAVEIRLGLKREQVVAAADDGTVRTVPVPEEDQGASSLNPEQVLALARAGLDLERRLGRPQDVEFAADAEGIFLLQARPVTTVEEHGPAAGNRIPWDHQNWAENYPGVTLPMTYSVTRRLEKVTYRCFAEMMRIDPAAVAAHQVAFETSLGYIRGRIYTHGLNRYRLFRLIPGISFHRKALLGLLGVRPEEVDRETPDPEPDVLRRWLVELPRLLRVFGGIGRDFLRVHHMVEDLLSAAGSFQSRCAAMDFHSMQPHELVQVYNEVELKLVTRWKAPLVNVFLLRLLYVTLRKVCTAWCGDTAGSLPQQLLRGEEGSESARPVRMLLALAHAAHRDPALRELFLREEPGELARRIPDDPRFAAFAAEVERYLDLFYFKGVHEMKLEDLTYRDRPELLYRMIQGNVTRDDPESLDPDVLEERERKGRKEAEERAFAALRGPRRAFFRWLLRHVRTLDRHREEFKFMRLQLMGLLRELLRAIGERLAEEGILDQPRDVFYLALEEVLDYVRGNALTSDLRGLVALRRRELDACEAKTVEPPEDQFETFGMVYHRNRYKARRRPAEEAAGEDGSLRGTGCCDGRVTGTVRILRSPADAPRLSGEILVVERIHTGWLPLLPTVSGLLVERGEILSHSTTVARELGIPTVVGIPGLTATLRDGQRVTVDGAQGVVTVLDGNSEKHDRTDSKVRRKP